MDVQPRFVQVQRRPAEVRTPGERLDGISRILAVRHDRLGDVILTLPALAALGETYPDAELTLAVDPSWRSLAERFAAPHRVLGLPRETAARTAVLAEERPDLLVCISRDKELAWAARFSRARHRVGTGRRFFSALFTARVDEPRREGGRHEVEYALSFAHRLGAPGGPERFAFDDDAPFLRRGVGRGVLLHPGSGGSCPRWGLPHYIELARRLDAAGIDVTVSSGPGEEALARRVGRDLEGTGVRRFDGDLVELATALAGAALVVSNSTGPLHLAAALGTPTLAVHAPWDTCGPARWGPYAANGWAVVAQSEAALDWSREERRRRASDLMDAVPVEVLEAAVGRLLRGEAPDGGVGAVE